MRARFVSSHDEQHIYSADGAEMLYERNEFIGKGSYGSVFVCSSTSDSRAARFALKKLEAEKFDRKRNFKDQELARYKLIKEGIPLTQDQFERKIIDRSNIFWYKSPRLGLYKYIALVEYIGVKREVELAMCINLFGLQPFGEFISDEGLQGKAK